MPGFRRTRGLCAALGGATLGLLAAGGVGRAPGAFSVEAIDVGQGDALLVRVPGGDATLVDTGPDPRAARRIARVLSRRGVREPVHLVLTHPHLDHAGGWATLARLWPPATVALPALAEPSAWAPLRPARRGRRSHGAGARAGLGAGRGGVLGALAARAHGGAGLQHGFRRAAGALAATGKPGSWATPWPSRSATCWPWATRARTRVSGAF